MTRLSLNGGLWINSENKLYSEFALTQQVKSLPYLGNLDFWTSSEFTCITRAASEYGVFQKDIFSYIWRGYTDRCAGNILHVILVLHLPPWIHNINMAWELLPMHQYNENFEIHQGLRQVDFY